MLEKRRRKHVLCRKEASCWRVESKTSVEIFSVDRKEAIFWKKPKIEVMKLIFEVMPPLNSNFEFFYDFFTILIKISSLKTPQNSSSILHFLPS